MGQEGDKIVVSRHIRTPIFHVDNFEAEGLHSQFAESQETGHGSRNRRFSYSQRTVQDSEDSSTAVKQFVNPIGNEGLGQQLLDRFCHKAEKVRG